MTHIGNFIREYDDNFKTRSNIDIYFNIYT